MSKVKLSQHKFLLGALVSVLLGLAWIAPMIMPSNSTSEVKAATPGNVEAGRLLYEDRCANCHGLEGDGNSPGAEFLYPRPRDFRRGLYKVRTTSSSDLPTDDDLFHIISSGMPGTSMPGWSEVLTEQQQRDVIAYIKTFARRFSRGAPPEPLTFGQTIPSSAESIEKGREIYFGPMECFKCHGQEGQGDGSSALEMEDDFGFSILPADLTKSWNFRGGDTTEDIVRTFITGMAGTPMPSYEGELTEAETWHLANFVRSLAPPQKPEVKAILSARRSEGTLPDGPDDPQWTEAEPFFYILVGQIMQEPRNFTPTVDAITVRALYNDKELALLLSWNDYSENRVVEGNITLDAVAIQFPVPIPEGAQCSYCLEGDSRHPVHLWYWQADGKTGTEMKASGLGTAQPHEADSQSLSGKAVFQDGEWRVVFKRGLVTQDRDNDIQLEPGRFIPIAFSAWDGHNGEVGSLRAVSTWYLLYLEPPPSPYRWLQECPLGKRLFQRVPCFQRFQLEALCILEKKTVSREVHQY